MIMKAFKPKVVVVINRGRAKGEKFDVGT